MRLKASMLVVTLVLLLPGLAKAEDCVNAGGNISPGRLVRNLAYALRNLPADCDWAKEVKTGFPNQMGGGSYNIPVVAAAIAFVREPIRTRSGPGSKSWNMFTWWDSYLRGELGERGQNWFYGGKELTSSIYQEHNVSAVLAVHYQAWKTGQIELRNQARTWLRATFAIQALAAAPNRALTFNDRGTIDSFDTKYSGPWPALAGMRSAVHQWGGVGRAVYLARATEMSSNLMGEPGHQNNLRTYLEANWAGPGGSVYGLNSTDRSHLTGVVQSGTVTNRIKGMLNGIHTITRLHLVRWGTFRLTLIEENSNWNTAPLYGVLYNHSTREAKVLYPWNRALNQRDGITAGSATLNLPSRYMEARNFPPTSPVHGQITVRITPLPAALPTYHVILDPVQSVSW
jgi:hypothetical protein